MRNFLHYFFYIIFPILILGLVFWYGWGSNFDKKFISLSIKEITLFETGPFNLGIFRKNGPVFSKRFELINKKGQEIYIKKIYSNCDCLSVLLLLLNKEGDLGPFSLLKEEYGKPLGTVSSSSEGVFFEVLFNPKLAPSGNFVGSVFFESNSGEKDVLRLDFKAKII